MTVRCSKRRYRSQVDALIAISSIDLRSKRNSQQAQRRQEQRAYQCTRCRGWHLTSDPER